MNRQPKILCAPMQGLTEAPFRRIHADMFGGIDRYVAPFTRFEKGAVRSRDLRDISPDENVGTVTTPQIIFKSVDELSAIADSIAGMGHKAFDLNMGCPFPPQMSRGRGSAVLANAALLEQVARYIDSHPEFTFSAKIRLGTESDISGEFIGLLNTMRLDWITVHPRTARQQYGGAVDLEAYARILSESRHPVIYNGDITSPSDATEIYRKFPETCGIMIGRGLLGRPTLAREIAGGHEADSREIATGVAELMERVASHYASRLQGDSHIVAKLKSFWPYLEPALGHKTVKALRKATRHATVIKLLRQTAARLSD